MKQVFAGVGTLNEKLALGSPQRQTGEGSGMPILVPSPRSVLRAFELVSSSF